MNLAGLFELSVGAALFNNIVLSRCMGVDPVVAVARKPSAAASMGVATTTVMAAAVLLTWFLDRLVLVPLELGYLRTLAFILVLTLIGQLLEGALQKYASATYEALTPYLTSLTANCAVLGASLIVSEGNLYAPRPFGLAEALIFAVFSGIGFSIVLVLLSGVHDRIDQARIPAALRGTPSLLVAAGLMALAFLGFAGR